MTPDLPPAEFHRRIAAQFTATVDEVANDRWDAVSPVADWRARDVVAHLTTWLPGLLESSGGPALPAGPSATTDPIRAWRHQTEAVQALLDDPASAEVVLTNPNFGEMPLPLALSRLYVGDVFMHRWDLARATGLEPALDEELAESMLEGMEPLDELLRSSGQYGPRVPVPADASAQDRLVGFIGRDPAWRAPAA